MMAGKDETEMKSWQHGVPLEVLKDIEGCYREYNEFACSPFSEVKKHRIAGSIADGSYVNHGFCRYNIKEAKVKGKINMYGKVTIGEKLPGDLTITNLSLYSGSGRYVRDATKTIEHLHSIKGPCWAFAWADWIVQNEVLREAGFHKVGTKITSFAEIYTVYFKNGTPSAATLFDGTRNHPVIDPLERSTLDQMVIPPGDITPHITKLQDQLNDLGLTFTDHYSNYNDKHSWGALSLRGYTDDPSFITKPSEMNNKWKKEHAGVTFALQDTLLRSQLPAVEDLLKLIPGIHHRIRLMRLTPNGGELRRHTDQVDSDAGVAEGQLLRFHFPIITNDKVKFMMWDTYNQPKEVNMVVGSLWSIDTRKPHTAVNNGTEDRIHLVVDVEADPDLRGMVYDALYPL